MGLFWKCAVVVAAATVQSLGLTLQRLSHLDPPIKQGPPRSNPEAGPDPWHAGREREASVDIETQDGDDSAWTDGRPWLESPSMLWRLGIAMFILANVFGSTVQLAVLPLVLVSTLQAAGLVANSVLACLILKEPLTASAGMGTLLVVLGAFIVAALGGVQTDPYPSLDDLFALFWTPRFTVWISATVLTAVGLGVYARRLAHSLADEPSRTTDIGWLWGIAGGIASAHSLLMAKLSIGLLLRNFPDILVDLLRFKFWVLVFLFLTFALSQMWCVNCGLRSISTSVLYPLVFCVYNVVTLANSTVLYESSPLVRNESILWVVLGTAVLISGVLLLSTRFEDEAGRSPVSSDEPSSLPRWLRARPTNPRINLGPLVTTMPLPSGGEVSARGASPVAASHSGLPSPLQGQEGSPLLGGSPSYTSFDAISPHITNPDKMRGRASRRVLSREQHQILRELGV